MLWIDNKHYISTMKLSKINVAEEKKSKIASLQKSLSSVTFHSNMFRMDFKVGKVDTDLWERKDYKGRKLEANRDKEELLCDLRVCMTRFHQLDLR